MNLSSALPGSQSSSRPLVQSPELTVVRNIVQHVLLSTGKTVESADRLRANIHLTYLLRLSDGSRCIFKASPSLHTRLLRREHHSLENQSRVLNEITRNTGIPVPRRMKYVSTGSNLTIRAPYLVRSYLPGTPLSELIPTLSATDLARIDQSLGVYFLALSSLTAAKFGSPHAIHADNGSNTWRQAFLAMLEAILRDAEDVLVSLPYDSIRYYVTTHSQALESVPAQRPQLTALNACLPHNVLIDESTMQVSGLLGLGDAVWGDPEMAIVFANPSAAFLEGYGADRIEETEQRYTRQLLYNIYRSIVNVVKHHYRPSCGEDELEARRSLAQDLAELASLPTL